MSDTESKITIKTDHKWRQFKYINEVPDDVWNKQFDHLDSEQDTDGYFKYRDWWYHLSDFTMCDENHPLRALRWQGYHSDSFYSGVCIRVHIDGGEYQVGTYMS